MSLKTMQLFISILFFVCACSCSGSDVSNSKKKDVPPKKGAEVAENKKVLTSLDPSKQYQFGVYIYSRTLAKYSGREADLVEACSKMGLTEVYLTFSNKRFKQQEQYSSYCQKIIQLFHQKSIRVYALTLDSPILIFKPDRAVKMVNNILEFNKSAPTDARFDGISADLEPHMLKKHRAKRWGKTELYWSSQGYGKGNDNDKLILKTLETFKKITAAAGSLPVSEAVATFYFSKQQKGDLSEGKPDAFFKSGCRDIIIMSYFNNAEKVIRKSLLGLNATTQPKSIMVAVKTSINTSGGEGHKTTFAGKTWPEFYQELSLITSKLGKNAAFRGIAFFEYEGLIDIWHKN